MTRTRSDGPKGRQLPYLLEWKEICFRLIFTKRVSALILVLDFLALSSAIKKIEIVTAHFWDMGRFDVAEILSDLHFKKIAEMERYIKETNPDTVKKWH